MKEETITVYRIVKKQDGTWDVWQDGTRHGPFTNKEDADKKVEELQAESKRESMKRGDEPSHSIH